MATLDGYLGALDGDAIAEAIAGDRAGSLGRTGGRICAHHPLGGFEALADGDDRKTPLATVPGGVVEADRWAEAWVARGMGTETASRSRARPGPTERPSIAVRPPTVRVVTRSRRESRSRPRDRPRPRVDRRSRFPFGTAT